MERMKKERPLIRYEKLSKEDLVDYCRVYWRRIHNDEVLFNEIYEDIEKLKEENRKLKDSNTILQKGGQAVFTLEKRIDELLEENRKLKEELEKLKSTYVYDAKQVRDVC